MLPLDPREKLLIVPTRVFESRSQSILRFGLDTGASRSMLNWHRAMKLGYRPANAREHREMTTASGVEIAPLIIVERLEAIGQQRDYFPLLCHSLPLSAGVDGVLGLDFFRGHKLTIDFRIGLATLE